MTNEDAELILKGLRIIERKMEEMERVLDIFLKEVKHAEK